MKQKLLEMVQVTVLFHTFPPSDELFFGSYKNGNGCQNWVTKADDNLVPGGHSLRRRGPVISVIFVIFVILSIDPSSLFVFYEICCSSNLFLANINFFVEINSFLVGYSMVDKQRKEIHFEFRF